MVANCDTFTWSSTSLKCELKKHINKQYGIDLGTRICKYNESFGQVLSASECPGPLYSRHSIHIMNYDNHHTTAESDTHISSQSELDNALCRECSRNRT